MPNPVEVPSAKVPTVSLAEVQGIILRGYELLRAARLTLLKIEDVERTRHWLARIASDYLTSAEMKPGKDGINLVAVNLAFSIAGFKALGLTKETCGGFSQEFQDGIDTDHHRRVLGDLGPHENSDIKLESENQSPDHWRWGNKAHARDMHVLLMVYANDEAQLDTNYHALRSEFPKYGLGILQEFHSRYLNGRKEHFGFRDGIAQPAIDGVYKEDPKTEVEPRISSNMVKAGEFLLGYPNEYGKFPSSPTVPAPQSGQTLDFGRNGSYLVFRQLQQDVPAFWKYIFEATRRADLSPEEHLKACVILAAKMVGRWPGGAPLSLNPDNEPIDTDPKTIDNDAYLFSDDPLGVRTPIGSHTRRSNPRDTLEPGPDGKERLSAELSIQVAKLHRIIRRGRPYGLPIVDSMKPEDIIQSLQAPPGADDEERGLLFLCFNANIGRQFEFIQQTWINNPKFGGLYRDSDPLMGQRHPGQLNEPADVFTVQAASTEAERSESVRQRFTGLKQFVQVRGGGYFFMPSIEAVKYLANVPCRLEPVPNPPADSSTDGSPPRTIAQESPPPREDEFIAKLTAMLMAKVGRDFPTGTTRRDAHAKHHGCVHAEFQVEPDLPPELKVGIFGEPRIYKAWIRFSNQDGVPQPDSKNDIRGMAIKLLGIPGQKLLEDELCAQTQDFLLISTSRFVTRDVQEFHDLIAATIQGFWHLVWFLINPVNSHFRVLRNLWTSLKRHANPLEIHYFSTTPYLFGSRAVKYSARPTGACASKIPPDPSRDYLREAMAKSLTEEAVQFDFLIQLQADRYKTPIEDPGQEWSQTISPFRKVATIRIPKQSFDSPEQMAFAENLSFTPWHSLPVHRPLGGINRARKVTYQAISVLRHQRNQTPRTEPGVESFPSNTHEAAMSDNQFPGVDLTPEAKTRLENQKLVAELQKTTTENKKLGSELEQIRKTTQKLEYEMRQLIRPYLSPQFWFTIATTVFSAAAVITALYGIKVQSSTAEHKVSTAELKLENAKTNARVDLNKAEAQRDSAKKEMTNLETEMRVQKEELDKASKELKETEKAQKVEQARFLQFVKFGDVILKNALKKPQDGGPSLDDDKNPALIAFADDLAEETERYEFIASLLSDPKIQVRRISALALSRLKTTDNRSDADHRKLSVMIIDALLIEDRVDIKRWEIAALGRLGMFSAEPLAEKLQTKTGEPLFNMLRALGEIPGAGGNPKVMAAIMPKFNGAGPLLQRQLIWTLGRFEAKPKDLEPILLRLVPAASADLLERPDSFFLAKEIISTLGKMDVTGKKKALAVLLPFLDVEDKKGDNLQVQDLRKELLITLGKAIGAEAKELAAPKIVKLITMEKRLDILEEAAIALGRMGDSKEVRRLLESQQPREVQAGVVALSNMDKKDAGQAIKELLAKHKEKFTSRVVTALKKRGEDAVPILTDALEFFGDENSVNSLIKEHVIYALGDIGKKSDEAFAAVNKALYNKNSDESVKIAALRSLEKFGQEPTVRKKVADIVQKFTDESRAPQVRSTARGVFFGLIDVLKAEKAKLPHDDKAENGKYYRIFDTVLEEGYTYRIDLMSRDFDAFLYLKQGLKTLAYDDDSGGNLNARLYYAPAKTGTYEIWATTYAPGALGNFDLEIRALMNEGPMAKAN